MDFEDDRPKPKLAHVIGEMLDAISLEELEQRIAILDQEIGRIRAEIVRKTSSKSAADAFFRQ